MRSRIVNPLASVSDLEVFFDLVFVYALSRVRTAVTVGPSLGLIRLVLLVLLIWWAWVAFTWIGSVVDLGRPWISVTFMASMGAMFVVAVWLPSWFQGGIASLVVALAYLGIRLGFCLLVYVAGKEHESLRHIFLKLRWALLLTAVALIVGAVVGGTVQIVLLAVVVLIEFLRPIFVGPLAIPMSIPHFVDRYGLVVMAAIGEGLLSLGYAASQQHLSLPLLVFCAAAFLLDCLLWSAYFRVLAPQLRDRIESAEGTNSVLLARDTFSYLHLLLVAGLVLIASERTAIVGSLGYSGWLARPDHYSAYITAIACLLITGSFALMRLRTRLQVPVRTWVAVGISILFIFAAPFLATFEIGIFLLCAITLIAFPAKGELSTAPDQAFVVD